MLLRPGIMLVHQGKGCVSGIIRLATFCSRFSHGSSIAYIGQRDLYPVRRTRRLWRWDPWLVHNWKDGLYVVESTTLRTLPCAIQGKPFAGVQVHPLADALEAYPGKIWAMEPVQPLSSVESLRWTELALDLVGKPYDTPGAVTAGTILLKKWLLASLAASRRHYFCIETNLAILMYAMQRRELPEIRPGEVSPAGMVKLLVRGGVYREPQRIK